MSVPISAPIVEKKIKKKKVKAPSSSSSVTGIGVGVVAVGPGKKVKKIKSPTSSTVAGKPKVKKMKAAKVAGAAAVIKKKAPKPAGGMTSSGIGAGSILDFKLYRDGKMVMGVGKITWKQSYSIGKSGLKIDGETAFPFKPGDRWSIGVLNCPTSVMSFKL